MGIKEAASDNEKVTELASASRVEFPRSSVCVLNYWSVTLLLS
jgi:hypothetical protein